MLIVAKTTDPILYKGALHLFKSDVLCHNLIIKWYSKDRIIEILNKKKRRLIQKYINLIIKLY